MTNLNGFSIFGGIVFLVVIFLVIHPISFRLPLSWSNGLVGLLVKLRLIDPRKDAQAAVPLEPISENASRDKLVEQAISTRKSVTGKRLRITINLSSAPLLGVLLLLITTTIGGEEIAKGIAGEGGSKPYDVLVLFISLAYIATSLDATGGLRYLAFRVALRAGSGTQLYSYLYLFFFASGAIIGNDPIILSGTPFLAYLTRVSGITPPTAWIYAQFLAANVSSAVLVSSNPTNVLISGAFGLNFLSEFTKYTVLPSFATGIIIFPVLLLAFRNNAVIHSIHPNAESPLIPHKFVKPDVKPKEALIDPSGAIFHTCLLLTTLAVLVGTSFLKGVEVWMITAPAGIVGLLRDIAYDVSMRRQHSKDRKSPSPPPGRDDAQSRSDKHTGSRKTLPSVWRNAKTRFPTTCVTLSRLPWPLLPFAIGMFILVRSLDRLGYISIFAGWTAKACTSPASAIFFVGGVVAFGLCPLCGTNIGATILAVEILANENFANAPQVQADPRILKGAIYAVAIASNTGALVTLPSSLAGLLWSRILSQKGIRITQLNFSAINLIPACIVTFAALGIVLIEVLYWTS